MIDRVGEDARIAGERRRKGDLVEESVETVARVELEARRRPQARLGEAAGRLRELTERAAEGVDVAPDEPFAADAEAAGGRVEVHGPRPAPARAGRVALAARVPRKPELPAPVVALPAPRDAGLQRRTPRALAREVGRDESQRRG